MSLPDDIRLPLSASKMRLDQALIALELAGSRGEAQALIMTAQVRVNERVADKAGLSVQPGVDRIEVVDSGRCPYVSRGGLKLARAIEAFGLPVSGRVGLDVGASTGGFTDCLLQHGASEVLAVDVGYGQLDWRLRQDPRVAVMERTNARHLTPEQLPQRPDVLVCDVSFISLKKVLPAGAALLGPDTAGEPPWMMALLKPQFECLDYFDGGQAKRFDGVIKDVDQRITVAEGVLRDLSALLPGWGLAGLARSPITGAKGNVELLTYWKPDCEPILWSDILPALLM